MIYFYKSISPHPIENLHNYLHHFFIQLFAEVNSSYDHSYFILPDFEPVLIEYKEQIDDLLRKLCDSYLALNPSGKRVVQEAYYNNNDIEAICNKTKKPYKFSELPKEIQQVALDLYGSKGVLYTMLTNSNNLTYKKLKLRFGTLKEHFQDFRKQNHHSICAFCGMENLLTQYDESKNEYDHYIPKSDYPFCSVNFRNLFPICDYCNKAGNKGQKDIPFIPETKPLTQGKLFYPYANIPGHEIILEIKASDADLSNPKNWKLNISCSPASNSDRKDRWLEIYNIENRYKSKISRDSYVWKDRIIRKHFIRCKKQGATFDQFKEDILDDSYDYKDLNNGILMKVFNQFIVDDPNCEGNLTGIIL